ncbi:alpha/beta hydrolase [Candidatus Woesearchaeota archaeon]|nr:alpha/beta hydrolase [Candidatus Woesearchaeota archaeon]
MPHKYIHSFDRTKIHYVIKRNKNKHFLVFLHGVGANWTIWKKQLEFFDYAGYSYIAVDSRGHGLSERPTEEKKYTFTNHAKDIKTILTNENIKVYTLIGHSLGGGMAINYIEQYKKLPNSLVLIDTCYTNPFENNTLFNLNKYISKLLRFVVNHQKIKEQKSQKDVDLSLLYKKNKVIMGLKWLQQCPLKVIVTMLDKVAEYTNNHDKKIIARLRKLNTPVLVMSSLYDQIIPIKHGENISRYAKNAVFKIIKDVHHMVMLDKSDEVNATILKFLENRKIKEYF